MQRYVTDGRALTIPVDIQVDGEFAVPDEGSLVYTLYDGSGAVVPGYEDQDVTYDGGDIAYVEIPKEANTTGSSSMVLRHVLIRFETNGRPYEIRRAYVIVPWFGFTVDENDVRSYLALNAHHLPNSEIDLVQAYFEVEARLNSLNANLADLLATGNFAANRAILIRAAQKALRNLEMRVAAVHRSESMVYERPDIDFEALRRSAAQDYAGAIAAASGQDIPAPILYTIATGTDPVTGA